MSLFLYFSFLCADVEFLGTCIESSSNRKRKNGSFASKEEPKKKLQRVGQDTVGCNKRSRIDVVMERAQACLRKIQRFKTSNM